MELNPRKQKILSAVVELYIQSGEPVGSKAICQILPFAVSSATVRNELSELSAIGLLQQPHTSAGRIPSQSGFRYYIDYLMIPDKTSEQECRFIDSLLIPSAYNPEKLLEGVSRALAGMTQMAAISITPSGINSVVRAVQFVQTSRRTAMIILMVSSGTMHTRVFQCEFDLSPEILRVFFRVFNEKLVGKPVYSISPAFIQTLGASMGDAVLIMSSALRALLEAAREVVGADVHVDGETNLLFYPDIDELDLKRTISFLSRPQQVYKLLSESSDGVLLGTECGVPALRNMGLIISKYKINGSNAGAIAVLGPMRIDYKHYTQILQYLAESVGRMLTEQIKI